MKLRLLLALLVPIVFFYSCNSDTNGVGPGVNGANGNVVVATINGDTWGAESGYYQTSTNFTLEIIGARSSGGRITLVVSPYNGQQTYQLNGITKIMFSENGVEYTSTTGQITVSSDDGQYIEGYFNCEMISNTGSQSLTFSNGQFLAPRR
ncbi:DUF6252 family protein [Polluticoccus soli]|uniref:DUF6252 family protein n=1 Tax=Polluticoccus soli TaxID=3034150 RepID=UPI0023E14C5F|nr:DUF6252 family protein [Flavipsychrobacter sp. JY13-12]